LRNGSLHRPGTENAQIVQFDRYVINIPLFPADTKATRLKRSSLTMNELLEKARLEPRNTENKRKLLIEYHKRLVLPVGCLMISLIGLPLGLQARPGKKAIGIQAGLGIFVLYYILFTFGKTLSEEDVLPITLAMWTPNFLFMLLAILWIIRITNEKPLIPENITYFFEEIFHRVSQTFVIRYNKIVRILRGSELTEEEFDDGYDVQTGLTAIRGNVKSRVFHLPGCEFYDCKNCTIEFKNIQIALDSGFEQCRFCHPSRGE